MTTFPLSDEEKALIAAGHRPLHNGVLVPIYTLDGIPTPVMVRAYYANEDDYHKGYSAKIMRIGGELSQDEHDALHLRVTKPGRDCGSLLPVTYGEYRRQGAN